MGELLERIKDRVSEKDSPIRTVKGVAKAIGMSEAGFYTMLKRESAKYGTLLAIAKSLNVDISSLTGDTKNISTTNIVNSKDSEGKEGDTHFGEVTLERIMHDMHEMRQVFEEQLRAKDRQIERLLDLLGKPEGAIVDGPLSTVAFDAMMDTYRSSFFGRFGLAPLFSAVSVAKLVAPRSL